MTSVGETDSSDGPSIVNQIFTVATGWGYAARCGCGWKTAGDDRAAVFAIGQRHLRTEHDLAARIWKWLPARTDSRRVTLPHTIAVALNLPVAEVLTAMAAMERAGHVVRNCSIGRQSGWHRGKPLPDSVGLATEDWPAETAPTLFDDIDDEEPV